MHCTVDRHGLGGIAMPKHLQAENILGNVELVKEGWVALCRMHECCGGLMVCGRCVSGVVETGSSRTCTLSET